MGRHPAVGFGPSLGEGVLITGGWNCKAGGSKQCYQGGRGQIIKSVEAYNPHIKKICKLPDLPDSRQLHTVCGGLLCSERSCLKLGPWGFVKTTVSLQQRRTHHLCWNVPEGVLLLGGSSSPSTTELVLLDGSASVSKFDLSYPAE